MSPSSNETSGMQLPVPVAGEQAPPAEIPQGGAQPVPEQAPAGAERASGANSGPAISIPLPAAMPQAANPLPPAQPATATNTTPSIADDNDLIEKEWVHKAKQIVERTRDDPYKQSEALTGVKVDYMKKRYNKTIKLS